MSGFNLYTVYASYVKNLTEKEDFQEEKKLIQMLQMVLWKSILKNSYI